MLRRMIIHDIVLADRLDVVFDRGLNVITGETGAGKSLLSGALSLALGSRGRANFVRFGADFGEVTAFFDLTSSDPVRKILLDRGVKVGKSGVFSLRRMQFPDGRTRAFIDDRPVNASFLKDVGSMMVEIHGQHDTHDLAEPASHRALLDLFCGLSDEIENLSTVWCELEVHRQSVSSAEERVSLALRDRNYLEYALKELDDLAPKSGEEESLMRYRTMMAQSSKVIGDLQVLLSMIDDGNESILSRLQMIARRLGKQLENTPDLLAKPVQTLDRVVAEVTELRVVLEEALGQCNFDPKALELAEDRLFSLRAIARKHAVMIDELPSIQEKIRQDIDSISTAEVELERAAKQLQEAELRYKTLALEVSQKRADAALKLDAAVMRELAPLKLDQSCFMTKVEKDETCRGSCGFDRVEFLVRTNAGTSYGAIHEIASGGELSRFALALKVVLADRGVAPTLVFDEIDSAVGGAVADAIGERLSRLAKRVQVVSVTHAPQVAARADHHLRISKSTGGCAAESGALSTRMKVEVLDRESRREEIARMLSGADITDEARAQANRLLSVAC